MEKSSVIKECSCGSTSFRQDMSGTCLFDLQKDGTLKIMTNGPIFCSACGKEYTPNNFKKITW